MISGQMILDSLCHLNGLEFYDEYNIKSLNPFDSRGMKISVCISQRSLELNTINCLEIMYEFEMHSY